MSVAELCIYGVVILLLVVLAIALRAAFGGHEHHEGNGHGG